MKKFVIFSVLFFFTTFFASATSPVFLFKDVTGGSLYFDAIDFLKDEGIVVGYEDGTFGYNNPINRAELLKIVVEARLFSDVYDWAWTDLESLKYSEAKNENCFSDVPAGEWYTQYVCYAKGNGWIEGYSDGTFKPGQNINFVEAIKIVSEVFDLEYAESDPWYKGLVEIAASKNIIPLTITDFGQTITRAEMADMVTRSVKADVNELDEFLGEKVDYIVTYETISEGLDLSKTYKKECSEAMYCKGWVDPMLIPLEEQFNIESSAFDMDENIPVKYTCDGEDINPPLMINNVPEETLSLALIVDDPDAPSGTWTHWIVWNIDPETKEIAENSVPDGSTEGVNDFEENGYGGPCPPDGTHHYYFKLYALDEELDLDSNTTVDEFKTAIEGRVLGLAQIIGLYSSSQE